MDKQIKREVLYVVGGLLLIFLGNIMKIVDSRGLLLGNVSICFGWFMIVTSIATIIYLKLKR